MKKLRRTTCQHFHLEWFAIVMCSHQIECLTYAQNTKRNMQQNRCRKKKRRESNRFSQISCIFALHGKTMACVLIAPNGFCTHKHRRTPTHESTENRHEFAVLNFEANNHALLLELPATINTSWPKLMQTQMRFSEMESVFFFSGGLRTFQSFSIVIGWLSCLSLHQFHRYEAQLSADRKKK